MSSYAVLDTRSALTSLIFLLEGKGEKLTNKDICATLNHLVSDQRDRDMTAGRLPGKH